MNLVRSRSSDRAIDARFVYYFPSFSPSIPRLVAIFHLLTLVLGVGPFPFRPLTNGPMSRGRNPEDGDGRPQVLPRDWSSTVPQPVALCVLA